ncbi:PepSY-associated TM helix domain-containing protein [Nostoc sp. 'Lobaria pulmonaria (5183) cyanobiont']|uniref:PepSY-associated TM helix domain-containing protein n=1 Tax=Nostoc sp. 'Lobaria pulmonaria (5183) cyanobiont' TaxID=1618022 RepID=UPI000CF30B8B|nr:PepSY-associated TM helix domain-containing protein [Nostoc sp. 'Lobaria pulmonaria (5183) cyanobiont']AVH69346.1 putative iron-regulated membrane protein PiuB [Nostoc sp. 'Lobaria pulmonaria (5183) cyanobiont']
MNSKKIRDLAFTLHRYLGLTVGLVMVIVGLTGSLLVFEQDFDHFMIAQQYGQITPQQVQVSPESVVKRIEAKYPAQGDFHLFRIYLPDTFSSPYVGQLSSIDVERTEVFINPYTGKIIGERISDKTLIGVMLNLHYSLMAGQTGTMFVGITAFLMCILTITGLVLWPGWHKLIAGFKIKLDAHPKRANFDIHKVAGIITVVFLFFTGFTGFCWNFYDLTEPIIYAVTFTSKPSEPVSKPIPGKSTLNLTQQLKIADAALPGAVTKSIYFPSKPEDALQIRMKLPQENIEYGNSNVYLDQYSGKVLRVDNGLKLSLGDRVLNSFVPLHYGTFWGLPSRILYVFVGLAPLILFITGFVMWRYRYQAKTRKSDRSIELSDLRRN